MPRATSTATAPATRVYVLSALPTLLCTKLAESRGSGRGCGRRAHAYVGQGGLIAAVGGGLARSIHGNSEVLLLLGHLLGELVVVDLGRDIGHLTLHLEVAKLLLWLNHAHVHILLVCGGDLLLLLLEDFNLLCNG
jgi:hypothetical protein